MRNQRVIRSAVPIVDAVAGTQAGDTSVASKYIRHCVFVGAFSTFWRFASARQVGQLWPVSKTSGGLANSPVWVRMPRSSRPAWCTAGDQIGIERVWPRHGTLVATIGRMAAALAADSKGVDMLKFWSRTAACAAGLCCATLMIPAAPAAQASVCRSIGGARVDVGGCADPFYELNDALAAPPPAPAPNVSVCVNAGRRISVSGCV